VCVRPAHESRGANRHYFCLFLDIFSTVIVEIFVAVYSDCFKVADDDCVSLCVSEFYCYLTGFCSVPSGWGWTLDSHVDIHDKGDLLRYDVTPPRAVRKVIFGLRLWRPLRQRARAPRHGIPSSCHGLFHTLPVRSHTARQLAVFGCLNIRSLLNKFDDVVELCRDRHIDLLCVTESSADSVVPVSTLLINHVRRLTVMTCPSPMAAS